MKSDMDNREWLNEYPSLKQVNSNNPFTVPDSYFGDLEEQIVSRVRVSELIPPSSQPFAVPDNYFEELNSNIVSRINIEEALKADEQSFAVPQNYFEDMEQQIKSRIAIEESLNAPMPFTVPDNYFEELSRSVLNQTAGLEVIKRKGMIRKLVTSASFKYASAACFALVVGAGIFIGQITTPKAEHDRSYLHKALSEIPDNDIEGYLQLHMDNTDTKSLIDKADASSLNSISTDDLKDYLSNN